jgi:hypothetical protein
LIIEKAIEIVKTVAEKAEVENQLFICYDVSDFIFSVMNGQEGV